MLPIHLILYVYLKKKPSDSYDASTITPTKAEPRAGAVSCQPRGLEAASPAGASPQRTTLLFTSDRKIRLQE